MVKEKEEKKSKVPFKVKNEVFPDERSSLDQLEWWKHHDLP